MRSSKTRLFFILIILIFLALVGTVVFLFDQRIKGMEKAQTPVNQLNK